MERRVKMSGGVCGAWSVPVRGHEVSGLHTADGGSLLVRAAVTHDSNTLYIQQYDESLTDILVHVRFADFLDHDVVSLFGEAAG